MVLGVPILKHFMKPTRLRANFCILFSKKRHGAFIGGGAFSMSNVVNFKVISCL